MVQFDPLEIQHKIEEKRLILGKKIEGFLLKKLVIIDDFFARLFSSKNCAVIGCAIIFLISIFVRSKRDIGQDTGLYLEIAQKLLNGGKYYQDFFENNLPFVYYLTMIPLFLAKIFAVSPIIVMEIFVNLIGIFTIYFSAKILSRSSISKDRTVFNLIILSFAAGFFLRIFTLQFNDFGTKSTYFLALFFPYLSYQFLKDSELKKSDQIFIGLIAGLLFCLKPHYGILVIAFESRKIYAAKSLKSLFVLRNYITFFAVIFYAICIFLCFPDYIKAIPAFASVYFNPKFFYPFFPLKEDIYPLLLLILPCLFLRKKFEFLAPLFFASLVLCLIVTSELIGVYDQRVLLYSVSLPLVSLVILALIRDQQINWRRDFITLLLILLIPQFDNSFFTITAFNICAFWWIFVLAMSQKWNKILTAKTLKECNFLRHIFLPREPLAWFLFIVLVVISIKLSSNRTINNMAWGFCAIIFILMINFYHDLHRKLVNKTKFSLLSASTIFIVLSYFVSLQSAAIFNSHEYKSPNPFNEEIEQTIIKHLAADENYIMISGRSLATYPVRNYVKKLNPLPSSELQILYNEIENRDEILGVPAYLLSRVKQQMLDPKNKLLFIEQRGLPTYDRCRIMFLEYYLRDAEFRKIFFENYTFSNRIIRIKPAERKVKFFSDKQVKSYSISAGDTVVRDIEVYVRK